MGGFRRGNVGFTLVEMLVVVSMMAGLVALAAPMLRRVRDRARVTECAQGMRQVWAGLSTYAQEHCFYLPEGGTFPEQLPAPTARLFRDVLDGQIELLYCRTSPQRAERLREWRDAVAEADDTHRPWIGYVYLAGSRFEAWDVPNAALPDDFAGARRVESVGRGVGGTADAVWLADLARCSTPTEAGRHTPANWALTNHPPQRVATDQAREDYRLPDGANVLFEDGHVIFRAFEKLRPRLRLPRQVHYW